MTAIDKADDILDLPGEHEDLQLDYDDADAILGDDPVTSISTETVTNKNGDKDSQDYSTLAKISTTIRQQSLIDEPEQLDYEEEIVSTNKESQKTELENITNPIKTMDDKPKQVLESTSRESSEPPKKIGKKYYINPKFKGSLPPSLSINLCQGPFGTTKPLPISSVPFTTTADAVSNVMIRSLMKPMNPSVVASGIHVPPPNFSAPPPNLSTSICNFPTNPAMSAIPMIPNLSVPPPPMIHLNKNAADASWNFMVEAFVRKTHGASEPGRSRRRSRSSSYSSRSRSYSSSSSGSSRSHSRSRSRSRRRNASRRMSPRRERYNRNEYKREGTLRDDRRKQASPKIEANTKECAEAIGLDEEYLKKIQEQKFLREEIARKKNAMRQQTIAKNEEARNHEKRSDDRYRSRQEAEDRPRGPRRLDRMDRERPRMDRERPYERDARDRKRDNDPSKYISNKIYVNAHKLPAPVANLIEPASLSPDMNDLKKPKLKAYLAVVVSNVKLLENVYKRISLLSSSVGTTKKVWQTSENAVSIIFEKHEHAKQFMLQYHGKTLNGVRLDVTLEKVFLNLNAML